MWVKPVQRIFAERVFGSAAVTEFTEDVDALPIA